MTTATELSVPEKTSPLSWLRRVGWLERIGLGGVVAITLIAILGPYLVPYDPMLRVAAAFQPLPDEPGGRALAGPAGRHQAQAQLRGGRGWGMRGHGVVLPVDVDGGCVLRARRRLGRPAPPAPRGPAC